MKRFLAIDPGASGGFAWRDIDGKVQCCAMPDTEQEVVKLIRRLQQVDLVIVERVGGFMGGLGVAPSGMFNFGCGFGLIKGAMLALNVEFLLVVPRKWQDSLQLGKKKDYKFEVIRTRGKNKGIPAMRSNWKEHLQSKAQKLYPRIKVTLKTADALLMLNYAEQFL